MKFCSAPVLCALVLVPELTGAVRLSMSGKSRRSSKLQRRGNISGSQTLADTTDVQYQTNLTLGGESFVCLIDTGSSDLWVAGAPPGAQDTGATSGVSYAVGEVDGPVKTVALEFAGFTVENQAYLEITPSSQNIQGTGLIGLGPSALSNILGAVGSAAGDPPLDRIFQQDTTTPNYLTILLSRSDDPDEPFPGDLSVGETLPGYDAITSQPKISVTAVTTSTGSSGQHWQVLLDENGIIGSDGKTIPVTSQVSGASNSKQATVVFDSGFSLPQLPKSASDAIYSGISGAKFMNISGIGPIWTLPCEAEVNITFVFSGVKYPVHPLDANLNGTDLGVQYDDGSEVCIGAFQPVSFDATFGTGGSPSFDMILGMAFLRNAYILIDFGDFVDGSTSRAAPYVQLLSLTNNTAAVHADFVKVRGGSSGSSSGSPVSSNVKRIAIIAGAVALGLLAMLVGLCLCCFRRRRGVAASAGYAPYAGGQSYRPLNEPAPGAAVETHAMPELYQGQYYNQPPPNFGGQPQYGGQPPYNPQGGQYQTAWDHQR